MESEMFFLYSEDVPLARQIFRNEIDAQIAAEAIARNSRGSRISIAKVLATVSEPLPSLQWSDERQAGDGRGWRGPLATEMGLLNTCDSPKQERMR